LKVLLLGAGGQLGQALAASRPPGVELAARGRGELDISDAAAVARAVAAVRPARVINCAAYTAVDQAEADPGAAFAVNEQGAANVAAALAAHGGRLLHLSTDYVFDGRSGVPYPPAAPCAPCSVYGASKRAGEERVAALLPDACVVRTAWLYAAQPGNFVTGMLARMGGGQALRVVADQVGTPTAAPSLARTLWALALRDGLPPVLHATDAGVASWYDLAVAVQEEALARGLLPAPVPIAPIRTADYPTAARRPAYSVLDCHATWSLTGLDPTHWRVALREVLDRLAAVKQRGGHAAPAGGVGGQGDR
jgi:dTDP-4-dehydrorhamnose reductase